MEYFSVSVGCEASHHQLGDFEPRQRGVPQSQVLPAFNIKYLDSVVSLNLKLVSKVFSAAYFTTLQIISIYKMDANIFVIAGTRTSEQSSRLLAPFRKRRLRYFGQTQQ